MKLNRTRVAGRHFLQIPGPAPVPDRILRAMDAAVIDHRGPEFQQLSLKVQRGLKAIFKTTQPVIIYPASGTGAWEAALVNVLSPGDTVLMYETGQFSTLWKKMAERLGLKPEFIGSDWRTGAEAHVIEERLRQDSEHRIKAVCVVHNETSTGATSNIAEIRRSIDAIGHPALFLVDTISSLASVDYRHDEWGVDVTVAGSQKGLMLPPGLSFNAVSQKAIEASRTARMSKSYWAWDEMIEANAKGFFPYTPATNLLYGLDAAIELLLEEGLDAVFARHARHGEATRTAVRAWGLEILCRDPNYYSPVLTGVIVPDGHSADNLRRIVLERFDMSLGTGLGRVTDRVFRIGHLGDTNDLTIIGALAGVEMGLKLAGIPYRQGGLAAAVEYLGNTARPALRVAAE
ncbi:MAG: aminotransferase class V-fold PLP-dependent enzyme [Hyphomicrobiaceae bacterium]|nr:aminotransferase class V-fold PLP-dependent enzyme [Hyphomicrobiaceae bacterium]